MKRIIALAFVGAVFAIVLASCGSSQGGHCDAYGSVDNVEMENDMASL